jgi:hypothetical protein
MSPDGFVMAGWFLGVCHVDSGREHQPALWALGFSSEWWWGLGVSGCAIVVLCFFVRACAAIRRCVCACVVC